MKLLLDENLSRRIVSFVQDSYPDSSQAALQDNKHIIGQVLMIDGKDFVEIV